MGTSRYIETAENIQRLHYKLSEISKLSCNKKHVGNIWTSGISGQAGILGMSILSEITTLSGLSKISGQMNCQKARYIGNNGTIQNIGTSRTYITWFV